MSIQPLLDLIRYQWQKCGEGLTNAHKPDIPMCIHCNGKFRPDIMCRYPIKPLVPIPTSRICDKVKWMSITGPWNGAYPYFPPKPLNNAGRFCVLSHSVFLTEVVQIF